jgi:hypothetical protein
MPFVVSDEHSVVLAYYLDEPDPNWDGTTVVVASASDGDRPIGIVRFKLCYAHFLGPPNDEAFFGHPLASRGLSPYRAFEVKDSSWIRRLERMSSVHRSHDPESFWKRRHLIFTFHDSTFECVCDGFEITQARGSIASVVPRMLELLDESSPRV